MQMAGAHAAGVLGLLWLPTVLLPLLLLLRIAAPRFTFASALHDRISWARRDARLASLVLCATAAIHLALVPAHLPGEDHGITGGLFLIDGVALALCALTPFLLRCWRPLVAALLLGNLLAYALYLTLGWETVDAAGLLTKAIEYLGLLASLAQARPLRSLGADRIGIPHTRA